MNRIAPIWMIRVNGRTITDPESPLVTAIEHTELGDGGKQIVVTVANAGLEFIDDPDFQAGNSIEWRFGYPGSLSLTYKSTITVIEPIFDAYDGLTLKLYAYDAIAGALYGYRQEVWQNEGEARITESEVVEKIADRMGVHADVEPTKNYVTEIAQSGDDWSFIQDLSDNAVAADSAHVGPYRAWFDSESGTLKFKPAPFFEKPKHTYVFMSENEDPALIRFEPKIDTSNPNNSGSSSTNTQDVDGNGDPVDEESNQENAERVRGAEHMIGDGVVGTWTEDIPGQVRDDPDSADPESTSEGAKGRGDSNLSKKELEGLEATIELVGDPTIKANDIISIRGVGQKLSGRYLCDQVIHIIDESGFITEITGKLGQLPGGDNAEAGGTEGATEDGENPNEPRWVVDADETTGEASEPRENR